MRAGTERKDALASRPAPAAWGWRSWTFLGCALGIGLLERLAVLTNPIHTLFATGVLVDDAFYYASFAREFADGHLFQLAPDQISNGFQPLFFLCIAPAWLVLDPDAEETLRVGLLLSSLASVATAGMLALWARRLGAGRSALAAGALWAVGPMSIVYSLNGMETALALCALTALGAAWPWLRSRPVPFGLLYAICVLGRIDALLLAPILAALAIRHWTMSDGARTAALRAMVAALAFASLTLPVAYLSWAYTGHLLPQSGEAVRTLTTMPGPAPNGLFALPRIAAHIQAAGSSLGKDLAQQLVPLPLPPSLVPALFFWELLALLLLPVVLSQLRLRPRLMAAPLVGSALIVALWIAAYASWVGAPWAYGRYLHGALLLCTLVLAMAVDFDRLARRRWGRVLAGVCLLLFTAIGLGKLDTVLDEPAWSAEEDTQLRQFVERRIADGELIGSFQSGRFGYWTRGAVANLDGVVDGAAARALREGRLATHLRERRIEWIIEEPHLLSPLFFNAPRSEPLSLTLVREGAFAAYRVGAPGGS
jgi:hypothetical protein